MEYTLEQILDPELAAYLEDAQFTRNPQYHRQTRRLELFLKTAEIPSVKQYDRLHTALSLALHTAITIYIQSENPRADLDLVDGYKDYFAARDPLVQPFQPVHPVEMEQSIAFTTRDEHRHAQMLKGLKSLESHLKQVGLQVSLSVQLVEDEISNDADWMDLPEPAPAVVERPRPSAKNGRRALDSQPAVSIAQALETMDPVVIEGRVFDVERRTTRKGSEMMVLYLSDFEEAIQAKRFARRGQDLQEWDDVKPGRYFRVAGRIDVDKFSQNKVFLVSAMEEYVPARRMDPAVEKRVEWHVHSNFSEMDGVCDVEEFIQQAHDWGMDAIALCDHNVVQAFPLAQRKVAALNKAHPQQPFKMIYGCEMSMVDTQYDILMNNDHRAMDDAVYVAFDLETTGLSQRLDEIIEFGAVKMKNREVIDRLQVFINPGRELPGHIKALTHIEQSDVDRAQPVEKVMPRLLEFIGDAVLVAHNAKFDIGFMNAALQRMGQPALGNPVIDTFPLAQAMLDIKRYNLGALCRHYNVDYEGEGAHRADYDAEVLSQVFCHILNTCPAGSTLDDLVRQSHASALVKKRPYHITVYARNKEGLKELFQLITLSHTRYLAYAGKQVLDQAVANPRIPRFELEKAHASGNLLFGSSCQNGELFELAHTRSEQELLSAAAFYDFIEVQPLNCYKNLLDRRSILDKEQLQQILGFLIEAGQKLDKPVIASGDAHYVHENQKRIRSIYINAKAIGNSRHPLYSYSAQDRKLFTPPDQHFLTTAEMLAAFNWLPEEKAREIVVTSPRNLASLIEPVYPTKDKLYPPDIEGSDQKLRDICFETAHRIYGKTLPEIVEKRLVRELDSIIGAGYYVVYYISHLLVKKSNEDGYLVGSRGSVGSSFVATMSGITEVNPLMPHYICRHCSHQEWIEDDSVKSGFDLPDKVCPQCGQIMRGDGQDIPFETFLGFEGDKVPDIDLNFSSEYQAQAHAYTREVFGDDHVFRAGTVGTVQEKTAYGYVKGYEEEMEMSEPFSEAMRVDLAKGCAGVKRTTGQHPGGIVVVPLNMDVHDFTPVQYPANNPFAEWKTTHFDFHQIHDNILKFDILGHVDPTAMKLFERMTGVDVTKIPMNDPETMSIFSSIDALKIDSTRPYDQQTGAAGLPEFGTPFVRGILELTRPTTFAELVSISGLSHGTDVWLNNAKDLIDNGTCVLSEVIGCRDDIMVDLMSYGLPPKAAFTIMESVRKGKGLKPDWEALMREHQVPEWYIDSCRKIKYMFPKAHAVAYVMNAVRIAWFKVHMPVYYYCQFFSIRCDSYDIETMIAGETAIRQRMEGIAKARANRAAKVSDKELAIYDTLELALEMVLRGYHFSNMSINRSAAAEFRVDPENERAIIPPFTALDGLGASVAASIVAARESRPFLSQEDILKRTQLSRTLLDKMAAMDALEGLDLENQIRLF